MTWFRVDDGFWSHPKTMLMSLEATGLWVRAGTWCAKHMTDGHIPDEVLRRVSPSSPRTTQRLAAELEAAGLWRRNGSGWLFHDWADYQPARQQLLAEKEATRRRQQRWRQRRIEDSP